ncbi:MAG: FtsQ-type POTRA domain-containing protein [Chlamydiales bacterium]|nr:FtsQ-type POTRA domain-containing protein [Chlamydiales bacterium]
MVEKKIIPLPIALVWIIASTLFTSFCFSTSVKYWKQSKINRFQHAIYQADRVIQTGPDKKALSTVYLCELMQLSKNNPIHLDLIDTNLLKEELLQSPVIQTAEVKKIYPSTIYVEYIVRRPYAFVSDYQNVAVDEGGFLFPLKPFFTPKRLTEFYFGKPHLSQKYIGNEPQFHLAKEILALIQGVKELTPAFIERIDVSHATHPSYGRREIVVVLRICNHHHIIRLNAKEYSKALGNYIQLLPSLLKEEPHEVIIDLRISNIAYIDETKLQ